MSGKYALNAVQCALNGRNIHNGDYGNFERKVTRNPISFSLWVVHLQDEYILIVNASLRDREFEQTFREFQNWLCRLAKRIMVDDVVVEVKDYYKSIIINNTDDVYYKMFESPSWCNQKW